jgi:lipopolysaccharide export system permease protein
MNLLFRYIFVRQAKLLMLIMGLGVGLYLLTELVERVDIFMDANSGLSLVATYFAARLPGIIAQILPAVFLLATVVTLCLMGHSRELTALHAGGIPFTTIAAMLVICGVFWGGVQFGCSQFLGVRGAALADHIWQEQVRNRDLSHRTLENVWFMDNGWVVSLDKLRADGEGTGLTAFHTGTSGHEIDVLVRARKAKGEKTRWVAIDGESISPATYERRSFGEMELPVVQSPELFFSTASNSIQQQTLWQLGETIVKLRNAGSNVEGLRTIWHGKISYSVSLVVMALLGAALVLWNSNIYIAVLASLAGTFVLYALTLFGESLGQRGALPPVVAAWAPDVILAAVSLGRLYLSSVRR